MAVAQVAVVGLLAKFQFLSLVNLSQVPVQCNCAKSALLLIVYEIGTILPVTFGMPIETTENLIEGLSWVLSSESISFPNLHHKSAEPVIQLLICKLTNQQVGWADFSPGFLFLSRNYPMKT